MPLELEVDNLDDLDVFQSTVESLKKIEIHGQQYGALRSTNTSCKHL